MAVGAGLEPALWRINSALGYQLPDPTVEPMGRIELPSPVYETGGLPLSDTGWRALRVPTPP